MAKVSFNDEPKINVNLQGTNQINATMQQTETTNVDLPPINYIPGYKEAEAERRANEVVRQENEANRIALYEDMEYKLETGYFNGEDGYSPIANVSKTDDTATITITDKTGTTTAEIKDGKDGTDGTDGQDGYSPTANVSKSGSTATITITDKNGTTTADISDGTDGQDGQDGADGYSPTATVSKSGKVATITITDKNGTTTTTIRDGEDGTGTGDMLKSTYDTNDNGIVDNAEKVNNHTVGCDVPADAVFTDTTYTAGTGISITNGVISNTQTSANWGNITGTLSDQTDLNTALSGKEDTTNKVTSLSNASTDTQYPSAKAVYDLVHTLNDMPLFIQDVYDGGVRLAPGMPGDDPVKKGIYIITNTHNLNSFWFYGGYRNFSWQKDYDVLYKAIIVPEDIPYMDQTTYRSAANRWYPIIQDYSTGCLDLCGASYNAAYGTLIHNKYISAVDNIYSGGFINLKGNQTITGTKTFSTLPQSSVTPSSNTDLVNKKYVDDNIVEEIALSDASATNDTKLVIESTDLDPQGTYITNVHSESTTTGYSAAYSNEHFGGVLLFNGTLTGTNSTTLNDAVENYEYLEVIGGNSLRQVVTKMHIPTSKRGKLIDIGMDGNVYIKYADFEVSGTTIQINQNREWWKPNNSASGGYNSSGNYITILRVIGYK